MASATNGEEAPCGDNTSCAVHTAYKPGAMDYEGSPAGKDAQEGCTPMTSMAAPQDDETDDRYRISDFLRSYTAFDVMPDSSKVVLVESGLSVYRAWRVLDEHQCTAAVVWCSERGCYEGLFSSSDIMQGLLTADQVLRDAEAGVSGSPVDILGAITVSQWNDIRRKWQLSQGEPQLTEMLAGTESDAACVGLKRIVSFASAAPVIFHSPDGPALYYAAQNTSLQTAISSMLRLSVHRLPVINEYHSVTHLLTYRNMCRFLVSHYRMPTKILQRKICDIGLGESNPETLRPGTPLRDAIALLLTKRLSAIPVVDDDLRCIDIFSKEDIVPLVRWKATNFSLDMPIACFLKHRPADAERLHTMSDDISLGKILKYIAEKRVHRVILVDGDRHIVSVVSLRHVLSFLALREGDLE